MKSDPYLPNLCLHGCISDSALLIMLSATAGSTMKNAFCEDNVVPGLLTFCHCTNVMDNNFYLESKIIVQDKVSWWEMLVHC
jgi:hypothetical protein